LIESQASRWALSTTHKPYFSNGNPVDVDYAFTIKLNLPR
jgi:hypothetical protein